MLKHNRDNGFTIIEVSIAIVLIMGGMIVAVVSINSRLRQENFYKGTSRFGSVLNDVLNDVSTNNWPHIDGWKCQWGGGNSDIKFEPKPGHQTGDGDCLYVGKVIQFGDEGTVVEDDNTYIVHTIMTHRSALIPIYEFDGIVRLDTPPGDRIHPLGVLEKLDTPPDSFSTRKTKSWPNGMQIEQAYYLDGSTPPDRVYLQGIAVIQQSGHGLKENDLLLQSGAGRVGIRVVHDRTPADAKNSSASRPNADDFAESLRRTPGIDRPTNPGKYSDISHGFNLPIYICIGDGRGREALALLGGHFSSLLVETNFDETEIGLRCS